jgi:REP element-mobilizing transposase RayT
LSVLKLDAGRYRWFRLCLAPYRGFVVREQANVRKRTARGSTNTEPGAIATGPNLRYHNRFGTPLIAPNERRRKYNHSLLSRSPVKLRSRQKVLLEEAIRETCRLREWEFWAMNVRTNHVHTVVGAGCAPERILIALKANATRKLRPAGCWRSSQTPWVERGSKRYLWTESDVINAVVYVECDQGGPLG